MPLTRSQLRELISHTLEEMSTSGDAGAYLTPFAFGKNKNKNILKRMRMLGYKEVVNEISYRSFKEDTSHVTNERKLKRAINEINKRITEINKVVDFSLRLKTESINYKDNFWDKADSQIQALSEKLQILDSKIKQLGRENDKLK